MNDDDGTGPWPRCALRSAPPGSHLCAFHLDGPHRARLAGAFVRGALAVGDRVVFVTDGRRPGEVDADLERAGVNAPRMRRTGQLVFVDAADAFAAADAVPGRSALAGLRDAIAQARLDGFPGVHVAGDPEAVLHRGAGLPELLRWEHALTDLMAETGAVGMCQYDAALLTPADAARLAGRHTAIADDDGGRPSAVIEAGEDGHVVALSGELDRANADALARALGARIATGLRVEIDMARVMFCDLSALRAIFGSATGLAAGQDLWMRNVPRHVRRLAELSGLSDPRVRVGP